MTQEQSGQRCAKLHGLLKSEIMLSGSPTRGVCTDGGVRQLRCPRGHNVQCHCDVFSIVRTLTRKASCRGRSETHRCLTLCFFLVHNPFLPRMWSGWWLSRAMSIDDSRVRGPFFSWTHIFYGAHAEVIVCVWKICSHTRRTAQCPCLR